VNATKTTDQRRRALVLGTHDITLPARPLVMGIINITPDSFSDGGNFFAPEQAADQFHQLVEWRRIGPVLSRVTGNSPVPISVDTYKAEIARRALDAGAAIINDISALRFDPEMAGVLAAGDASVILMHMQGTPRNMQKNPVYHDVVVEVKDFLTTQASVALAAGLPPEKIIVDPGIGFGKTLAHNLYILQRMKELANMGYPVLIGASRKSFIGRISGANEQHRLAGSLAAAVLAAQAGVNIVRVHDVRQTRQALEIYAATADPEQWVATK